MDQTSQIDGMGAFVKCLVLKIDCVEFGTTLATTKVSFNCIVAENEISFFFQKRNSPIYRTVKNLMGFQLERHLYVIFAAIVLFCF